jgi:predicted GNAT family N-acyltransferase
MAVEPARQGEGLGGLLLVAAIERLRHDGVRTLWANARLPALPFYERHGFTAVGEPFDEIGIPHVLVVRELDADLQSDDG